MKLLQARSAAAGGGVLRHEHRMPPVRRLLTIVPGHCRRQAFGYESPGMLQNEVQSPVGKVSPPWGAKVKLAATYRANLSRR